MDIANTPEEKAMHKKLHKALLTSPPPLMQGKRATVACPATPATPAAAAPAPAPAAPTNN